MLTREENDLLCRVEGDAPMGQSDAPPLDTGVPGRGGQPSPTARPSRRARSARTSSSIRDSDGRVGVLDEACPHRRASLVYGRNEGRRAALPVPRLEDGRATGNVLEMASGAGQQAAWSTRSSTRPTRSQEWGGIVWAWFGPKADAVPPFAAASRGPRTADTARQHRQGRCCPATGRRSSRARSTRRTRSSLHSSDMVPARVDGRQGHRQAPGCGPSTDKAPRMQVQRTGYGFRYAALRRPIQNAATLEYVRSDRVRRTVPLR
jgi:phthalate 4,5-dioxygenase oxygenase subunit